MEQQIIDKLNAQDQKLDAIKLFHQYIKELVTFKNQNALS